MKRFFLLVLCFWVCKTICFASDTITIMHYNLMYYDHNYAECNDETNNVYKKNSNLATILSFVQPDILTVNEVGCKYSSVNMILDSTLNIDGITHYARANMVNEQYMTNMIYFNKEKVQLLSQSYANTSPRKTQFYNFKLINSKDPNTGNPVYFTCAVTHLKAGSYPENIATREAEATIIMDYIDENEINGNVLFMGDMNLYTNQEPAFQLFTSPTPNTGFRFYDPLNRVGSWGSNTNFCDIHTQSTHKTHDGCFSYGGMNDRFDFILASNSIITGSEGFSFQKYATLGQDGKRYNQSLISPSNLSVPSNVLNALYNMSDHLPVIMKLTYQNSTATSDNHITKLRYNNPVSNRLNIIIDKSSAYIVNVNIYSVIGKLMLSNRLPYSTQSYCCDLSSFNRGIFIVEISLSDGTTQAVKVIKQ